MILLLRFLTSPFLNTAKNDIKNGFTFRDVQPQPFRNSGEGGQQQNYPMKRVDHLTYSMLAAVAGRAERVYSSRSKYSSTVSFFAKYLEET